MEAIPSAVVLVEASNRRAAYANRRAVELYGADCPGLDLSIESAENRVLRLDGVAIPIEDMPAMRSLTYGEQVRNKEMLIRKSGGQLMPVSVSSAPLLDAEGRIAAAIITFEDISERMNAQAALRESEERFGAAFRASPAAMSISRARDGRIIDVNDSFTALYGFSREEAIGKCGFDLKIQPEPAERAEIIRYLQRHGPLTGYEATFTKKTGEPVSVLCWLALIKLGDEPHVLGQAIDITERKKAEQVKDDFIGMVSHELKTPLTVVMGALDVALTEVISEEEKNSLMKDAAWGADKMADVVDNLLELSRWQSDRLRLDQAPLDLGQVVNSLMGRLSAKSPQHRIVANIAHGLPAVRADRMRIQRIFDNIVDNAIKYSPSGGEILVSVEKEDDNILVGVRDRGIGISKADAEKLFRPFAKLESPVAGSAIQGIGLGLVVCRRLVEAHGGRIWVDSRPGKGSTFYFTLPL